MADISIYDKNETDFNYDGTSLIDAVVCEIEEELNGKYLLELRYPIFGNEEHSLLTEESIIKADGQLFRIHSSIGNLGYREIKARHIFYDLLHNLLEDVRPTDMNLNNALNWILDKTQYPHNFRGVSDVGTINTKYFIRKNPVEAILGDDGLIANWGGEIIRDNYYIRIYRNRGKDKGAQISYGKNLLGLEVEKNMDEVATRVMPIGRDGLLLPEKYIDSPLIDNYIHPYIKVVEIDVGAEEAKEDSDGNVLEEAVTEEEALEIMRQRVNDLYEFEKIDIPPTNIKADLVLLENTEEYKHLKHLVKVELGDTVSCTDNPLNIEFEAKVIRVKRDILNNRNVEVELGQFKKGLSDTIGDLLDEVREEIEINKSDLEKAVENATNLITSALGGYVIKREGEILIMDDEDPLSATRVWRWNLNGLGYSGTGVDGPYRLAMTMDGEFVADFITTGVLNASLLKTGLITPQVGDDFWNLENGHFKIGGLEQDEDGFRVHVGDKYIDEYIDDKVFELDESSEYTDEKVIELKELIDLRSFEELKREIESNKSEINARSNALYYHPGLLVGGIDSGAKNILGSAFTQLNIKYNTLRDTLIFMIQHENVGQSWKDKANRELQDYLDEVVIYNGVYENAYEYVNLSVDEKLQLAEDKASDSLDRLDEYNDDKYWTPLEKRRIKQDIDEIKAEFTPLMSQSNRYGVPNSAYRDAYDEVIGIFENTILAPDKMDETTYHPSTSARTAMANYFTEKMKVMRAIDTKIYEKVDELGRSVERSEQTANDARDTADNAFDVAELNLHNITNIASDNKVIPKEKRELVREWESIKKETTNIINEARRYGVPNQQLVAVYENLNAYLTPILRNLNTTSTIERSVFITNFVDYYSQKMLVLNLIAQTTKEDLDRKLPTANLIPSIEANLRTGELDLQGKYINMTGAVRILSGITNDLGTMEAGLLHGPGMDINLNQGYIDIESTDTRAGFYLKNANGQVIIDGKSNVLKVGRELDVLFDQEGSRNRTRGFLHHQNGVPAILAYQTRVDNISGSGLLGAVPLPAMSIGLDGSSGDNPLHVSTILRTSINNKHVFINRVVNDLGKYDRYARVRVIVYKEAVM